jgi:hypothetical protein
MSDTPTPDELEAAQTEQEDPRFIRYTIERNVIDGPAIPDGTEVTLRLFACVTPGQIGTETGELLPITRLVIRDWYGPVVERYGPPTDPEEVALRVLAEYVTLPYGDDKGVYADPRNREMMRRVIAAYDMARERPQHDRPAQMSEPSTTEESAK